MPKKPAEAKLVEMLNQSLGWELRAQAMYAHYAAYVKGLESLTLAEHFEGEVTESLGHARKVRDIIAALGGEAVTTGDETAILHTEDTRAMLEEALKTESAAAAAYRKIIPLVKDHPVFYHDVYHILKDETAAVIEVETLLGRGPAAATEPVATAEPDESAAPRRSGRRAARPAATDEPDDLAESEPEEDELAEEEPAATDGKTRRSSPRRSAHRPAVARRPRTRRAAPFEPAAGRAATTAGSRRRPKAASRG